MWRIDTRPMVIIGEGGGPEYELARVLKASRYSGGYVVTTLLPPAIRVYDERGRFQRRIGRVGDGPGEFRSPSFVWVGNSDELIVYDPALRRITYFGIDGGVLRTVRYRAGGSFRAGDRRPRVVLDRFSDGSFLTVVDAVLPSQTADRSEITRPTAPVYREDPPSFDRDTITTIFGGEMVYRPGERGMPGTWHALPFSHRTGLAAYDTVLFVASNDAFRLEEWSFRGRLLSVHEKAHPLRPLTTDIWEGELNRRIARFNTRAGATAGTDGINVPTELASIRSLFDRSVPGPWLPVHAGRMLADTEGNVWIRAWSDDASEPSSHWHIFHAATRTFTGPIELPAKFRPTAIYSDGVIGVQLDEWNVETVREYRLLKAGDPFS